VAECRRNGGASTNGGMSTKRWHVGEQRTIGHELGAGSQSAAPAGQNYRRYRWAPVVARANGGSSSPQREVRTNSGRRQVRANAPDLLRTNRAHPSRVDVYQVDGSIIVNLSSSPGDPANITSLDALPLRSDELGGDADLQCRAPPWAGVRFLTLQCPAAVPIDSVHLRKSRKRPGSSAHGNLR